MSCFSQNQNYILRYNLTNFLDKKKFKKIYFSHLCFRWFGRYGEYLFEKNKLPNFGIKILVGINLK